MALLSGVSTAVGIVIVLAIDWFPAQASTAAPQIDTLWDVLMIASVPVFVLVMAVALYSVFAFRAQPGDLSDGEPIHGNTRLEVIWVTIPFIMVSALAVYGWIVLDDIEAKQTDPLIVNVTGQQFAWRFDYPDEGEVKSTQLVLPKDRDVEFRVNTDDVLHDFWVPEFRLKTDAVPGLTTKIRLKPSRIGEYDVVCAELCGLGHSTMRAAVRVVTPEDFDAWIAKEQKSETDGGAAAAGGDEAEREHERDRLRDRRPVPARRPELGAQRHPASPPPTLRRYPTKPPIAAAPPSSSELCSSVSQSRNSPLGTTSTVWRMVECPRPHSSAQTTL